MAHSKVLQTETRELASLSRGKIRPGESDEWKNEQLYVPPLPPTNLRGCHLIKIQYDVYVSISSSPRGHIQDKTLSGYIPTSYLSLLSSRDSKDNVQTGIYVHIIKQSSSIGETRGGVEMAAGK